VLAKQRLHAVVAFFFLEETDSYYLGLAIPFLYLSTKDL